MKLTEMKEHATGEIIAIHMDEKTKARLCHVGLYEGAIVNMERKGAKGHPFTLLVCGYFLMMRYADGTKIEVEIR